VHYFQDRVTRSIYSGRELGVLVRRGEFDLRDLLLRFEVLPEGKRRLLEETEAEAARVRGVRSHAQQVPRS
jgi:hypothetical protein